MPLLYIRSGHSGTQDGPGVPVCVAGREKGKLVARAWCLAWTGLDARAPEATSFLGVGSGARIRAKSLALRRTLSAPAA